jgi:hypothetical protein
MRFPVELLNVWKKERMLLIETALYLVAARVALKIVPFRRLEPLFNRRPRAREVSDVERDAWTKKVQWAVVQVSRHWPVQTTCFSRAIAAQAMLRRRGIVATLFYGAGVFPRSGLRTHVWLQDGTDGVIGHLAAAGYHILARYPAK